MVEKKTLKQLSKFQEQASSLNERLRVALQSLDDGLKNIGSDNVFEERKEEKKDVLSEDDKKVLLDDFLEELAYERGRRIKRRVGKQVRHDRSRHADY